MFIESRRCLLINIKIYLDFIIFSLPQKSRNKAAVIFNDFDTLLCLRTLLLVSRNPVAKLHGSTFDFISFVAEAFPRLFQLKGRNRVKSVLKFVVVRRLKLLVYFDGCWYRRVERVSFSFVYSIVCRAYTIVRVLPLKLYVCRRST